MFQSWWVQSLCVQARCFFDQHAAHLLICSEFIVHAEFVHKAETTMMFVSTLMLMWQQNFYIRGHKNLFLSKESFAWLQARRGYQRCPGLDEPGKIESRFEHISHSSKTRLQQRDLLTLNFGTLNEPYIASWSQIIKSCNPSCLLSFALQRSLACGQ